MPILMSKEEWARLSQWMDENRDDAHAIWRREYVRLLDEKSREMTKDWPNSLENVNKRNEEMRRARHDKTEMANIRFYRKYIKQQIEDREKMMYTARDTIFKNKDAPKMMLTAVIESVVQKEREEQLKFKAKLKQQDDEEKRAEDDEILRKAKEWEQTKLDKTRKRIKVNQMHQKEMFEYANELRERRRKEAAEELARETEDNARAEREMETIREFEEEYKAKEKKRIWNDNELSRKEIEQRRREEKARDKLDDDLLAIWSRAQQTIECKRRQTEGEHRAEKLRILNRISQRLATGTADRDAHEQAVLEKAQAQRLANEEARNQAWVDKEARNKAECIAAHEKFLRDEEQRIHEETTLSNWQLINRFKNVELYEDYKQSLVDAKAKKIHDYRTEINKLRKERADRDLAEYNATKSFYGDETTAKFREADNRLLTHAAELIKEAEANGRPTLPILKAIDRYCKMYRLYPLPPLPKSLQAHFPTYAPVDGSQPDVWYRPPPPPKPQPDIPDDDKELMANGLQDFIMNIKKTQKAPKPKETKIEPVKGPTNGLQPVEKKPDTPATPKGNLTPCIAVLPVCLCQK